MGIKFGLHYEFDKLRLWLKLSVTLEAGALTDMSMTLKSLTSSAPINFISTLSLLHIKLKYNCLRKILENYWKNKAQCPVLVNGEAARATILFLPANLWESKSKFLGIRQPLRITLGPVFLTDVWEESVSTQVPITFLFCAP